MRVLSLGHRMMNPKIDNHTIFNAPNLIDYDAIVIDPLAVSTSIATLVSAGSEVTTHADVPVVNGESAEEVTGLAGLLQRRRDEVARALEHGAVVCVMLVPQSRVTGVLGLHGLDRYFLLPAPEGMAWDAQTIHGGEGRSAAIVDHCHPLAAVFETYHRDLLYRAYFNDRAPGFARHAKVLIRSLGGAPVGVEFAVGGGRLVFLPTPREAGVAWLAPTEGRAMVQAMAEMHRLAEDEMPTWARSIEVPGLAERLAGVEEAKGALSQAEVRLREAEASAAELGAVRAGLWAGNESSLLPAVLACAEALGFERGETPEGDPLLTQGETALHLVVAASDEAVDMAPHYRLRQRLDAILAARATAARGLVVVNGQRLSRPEERKREFTDSLRVAAESVGYGLVTTRELVPAAIAALGGGVPDDRLLAARQRLISTKGVITLSDLLPAAEA